MLKGQAVPSFDFWVDFKNLYLVHQMTYRILHALSYPIFFLLLLKILTSHSCLKHSKQNWYIYRTRKWWRMGLNFDNYYTKNSHRLPWSAKNFDFFSLNLQDLTIYPSYLRILHPNMGTNYRIGGGSLQSREHHKLNQQNSFPL